jgi:twinkle protein
MTITSDFASTAAKPSTSGMGRISLKAGKWLRESRGISPETLAKMPVDSGTEFFPECGEKLPCIRFLYPQGWKARSYPDKHHVSGGDLHREFWNLAAVLKANPERVYIVEGEPDALALVEVGIPSSQVLAAHGAKDKPTEGDPFEYAGYAYVKEALEAGLCRVKQFIWCGDEDAAGLLLREDMMKMLGAPRFHFINWPEGIKDANDMLLKDGPEDLLDRVTKGSLPWPIEDIYRLSKLPEPAPMVLWEPGFVEWERKIMLSPRTLSVVTGHPGHGKTAVWAQIWYNIVRTYCIPICVATFETRPKPHMRRQLRTLFHGGLRECEQDDEMRRQADAWIDEMYLWLVHSTAQPTLEWLLEKAEAAVIRHGCRIIQIDPWNRLEASRAAGEREDEYVGRCLRRLHQFANDFNCHVQVLAHPSKMEGNRRGHAPMLEDIAGAKHWDNMPDQGFTVHRPNMYDGEKQITEAVLYHRKARFEELGRPCKLGIDYDKKTGKFKSVDYDIR